MKDEGGSHSIHITHLYGLKGNWGRNLTERSLSWDLRCQWALTWSKSLLAWGNTRPRHQGRMDTGPRGSLRLETANKDKTQRWAGAVVLLCFVDQGKLLVTHWRVVGTDLQLQDHCDCFVDHLLPDESGVGGMRDYCLHYLPAPWGSPTHYQASCSLSPTCLYVWSGTPGPALFSLLERFSCNIGWL